MGLSEHLLFSASGGDRVTEKAAATWVWRQERNSGHIHSSVGRASISAVCRAEESGDLWCGPLEPWFSHLSHGSHNTPERAVLGLNDMVPRTYLMNGSDPKHGGNHYTVPVLSVNYCVEFDPYNNPML